MLGLVFCNSISNIFKILHWKWGRFIHKQQQNVARLIANAKIGILGNRINVGDLYWQSYISSSSRIDSNISNPQPVSELITLRHIKQGKYMNSIGMKDLEENNLPMFQLDACTGLENIRCFRIPLSGHISVKSHAHFVSMHTSNWQHE